MKLPSIKRPAFVDRTLSGFGRMGAWWTQRRAAKRQARLDSVVVWAAEQGYSKMIDKYLAKGASAKAVNNEGISALALAVSRRDTDLVKKLLEAGADPDVGMAYSGNPILIEALALKDATIAKMLLAADAKKDVSNSHGVSALAQAIAMGHADLAKEIAADVANINKADYRGRTAIYSAIRRDDAEMVDLLVSLGARVDIYDRQGHSPLDYARHYNALGALDSVQAALDALVPAWQVTAENEIASVSIRRAIGLKLTDIFNLEKGECHEIVQDLTTGQLHKTTLAFKDVTDQSKVEAAKQQYATLKPKA